MPSMNAHLSHLKYLYTLKLDEKIFGHTERNINVKNG